MMSDKNNLYGLILAGGSGSRLWPLSRELYPKQLLNLIGDKTLLQGTFARLETFINPENIVTITNEKQAGSVENQTSGLVSGNSPLIIGEPAGRNTAPAIGLAALVIDKLADDPVIFVTPSDHLIKDEETFAKAVQSGIAEAEKGNIVTFGITPNIPETGYGYIKASKNSNLPDHILKADEFREKPDLETAKKYLESGNYFWNSGMFMFKASTIFRELEKHSPEIMNGLEKINTENISKEAYEAIPSISIDYAVMEKSEKIVLIPVDCGWNDLGSWQSLFDIADKDKNNNYKRGNVIDINTKNSLIFSESRIVSAIGIENTVIVETEDAVMVCNKESSQDVKKVFEKLKSEKNEAYSKHKTTSESWGKIKNIEKTNLSETNKITIAGGKNCKGFSEDSKIHIVVTAGKAELDYNGQKQVLQQLDSLNINKNNEYQIKNPLETTLEIIEIKSK